VLPVWSSRRWRLFSRSTSRNRRSGTAARTRDSAKASTVFTSRRQAASSLSATISMSGVDCRIRAVIEVFLIVGLAGFRPESDYSTVVANVTTGA
jgi:hypothetical protein